MAKVKLNEMTQNELEAYENQLQAEIKSLTQVVEASNTTVFDILINEVKEEMRNNIAEEEWRVLKENQKKIESYRSIEKALQNQEELLTRKQDELADVQNALKNYQTHLFEPEQAETTNFEYCGTPIQTGDVFKKTSDSENDIFYLVKKSVEIAGSFAIISNCFEGERLLQYPSNLKLLEGSEFVGNIYGHDNDEALNALKIIADSQDVYCEQSLEQSEDTFNANDQEEVSRK